MLLHEVTELESQDEKCLSPMPGGGHGYLEKIPECSLPSYVKKVAWNEQNLISLHMGERFRVLRPLYWKILKHIYDGILGREETV